ncbi:S46 family peptidase [Porphyromonas sp.]|uniref:S46 family peptidase n=1 Tax=Porphyromonas sp. TaxID=1924944 RepID=UPI0026DB944B|nr:S46 family peptidase [Porphyromonas sp.]MDO4771132.1 S46 family peptidase [Porphyromonas sp.]
MKTYKKICAALLTALLCVPSLKADEGMWLLPYLKQQNIKRMQEMGLTLSAEQIYNPGQGSVIDAVVHFDGGCTGELISSQGLLLTNHHCGYDQIREHSTVTNNFLRDGFYAPTMKDELPNPGLVVTFIDEIVDVTDYVNAYLKKAKCNDPMEYLSRDYLTKVANAWYKKNRGKKPGYIVLDLAPFYEGNKFILSISKEYSDVRLVAAPPSSIGSYGADTDNWVWPRHSGDFCVFRIYTDKDGKPAKYDPNNVPMRPKFHFKVNSGGLNEDDFVMIMGYPGRTNHFYTAAEVAERRDIDNTVRIDMRKVRQETMLAEMRADEAVNIQYASKYARSTNAYKNAIGSNWAIRKMDFEGMKKDQQAKLTKYATENNKPEYIEAMKKIEEMVAQRADFRKQVWMIDEGLLRAVESVGAPVLDEKTFNELKSNADKRTKFINEKYLTYFNKDYNKEVDRKVTKAMLTAFINGTAPENLPAVLRGVKDINGFVNNLLDKTIYRDASVLESAIINGDYASYDADPVVRLSKDVHALHADVKGKVAGFDREFARVRKTYVKGIMEMEGEMNVWPDANSTVRYTFGKLKGYIPRDNVYYGFQTTMEGVMEKEDPTNPEYTLSPKLKDIYNRKDFGSYALANGKMPVDICATTHTTGGNSGSPVIDKYGNLVGLNFDRNWEGVGGDINYLADYQRSIICDVRYVLLILDKYLGAQRLIDEMDIAK